MDNNYKVDAKNIVIFLDRVSVTGTKENAIYMQSLQFLDNILNGNLLVLSKQEYEELKNPQVNSNLNEETN